jgi:heat shock protein HslJ
MFSKHWFSGLAVVIVAVWLAACGSATPASTPIQPPTLTPSMVPTDKPAAVPPPTDELRQLRAKAWQWESFTDPQGTTKIDQPAQYRVTFNTDATLNVIADCNTGSGSYQGEGGKLTIELQATTRAACGPASHSDQFIKLLNSAARYFFQAGQLHIDLLADGGTLLLTLANAETTAPVGQNIKAVPFDLGPSVITQTWVSSEKFRYLPIELEGLIAAPPTGENLPIAVIMHGSHEIGCPSPDGYTSEWPCPGKEVPNYRGFAYLLEALAARGYVAISINANPAFVSAYGMPSANDRLPLLLDQYLAKIAAANDGEDVQLGVDLKGRLDWKQLVVLGHSAGGEAVNWVIDSRAHTTPDQIDAGQGPIAAAILLAPTAVQDTAQLKNGSALAVILPACDRDVADLSGQKFYETARLQAQRDKLVASVYLPGMNHNRFNTELGDETLANTSSLCENALVPAEEQRQFLADYVTHFFDAVLKRGTETAADLDPAQPALSTLFDRTALTSLALPTSQRLRLPLKTAKATGAATAVWCEAGYGAAGERPEVCRRSQYNQPGAPDELALAWNGAQSALEVALPQAQRDLSDYATLHLRAVVDPIDPLNQPGQPQAFSMRLTDGAGKSAVVALKDEPALAFPAGKKGYDDSLKLDTWDNHVILSSIRVPLAKFSGVDLSDIRSAALVFDQIDHGSIFVTDLEFFRTAAGQ